VDYVLLSQGIITWLGLVPGHGHHYGIHLLAALLQRCAEAAQVGVLLLQQRGPVLAGQRATICNHSAKGGGVSRMGGGVMYRVCTTALLHTAVPHAEPLTGDPTLLGQTGLG
jgi:hypothetical protein